ncbi:MAG: hypothetical protein HZB43_00900 [candidate division Zixibacteria bacterium]|nr:hypothetical protein [candidate division Zixibacteria bacterium]
MSVANVSLLNTAWYLTQVLAAKPSVGLTMTAEEIAAHGFRAWRDTTIAIPTSTWTGPTDHFTLPDTLRLHVPATAQNTHIFGHDDIIIRLIQANRWQRPIYFTSFALHQLGWLRPYLRPEGLVHRLMPVEHPPADTTLLIANLLTNYSSRGYADPTIVLEPPSRWVAQATYAAFFSLAQAESDRARCQDLKARLMAAIPLERIGAPEELVKGLAATCGSSPTPSQ